MSPTRLPRTRWMESESRTSMPSRTRPCAFAGGMLAHPRVAARIAVLEKRIVQARRDTFTSVEVGSTDDTRSSRLGKLPSGDTVSFTVSCRLHPVSCFLSPVSCLLSPVSCFLFPVSCFLFPVSCLLFPVSCLLALTGPASGDLSSSCLPSWQSGRSSSRYR
jgi:hypothetical protein